MNLDLRGENELVADSFASQLLALEEERDWIDIQIKKYREALMAKMRQAGIKTIKTGIATFTVSERKDIKVDKDACKVFLDSAGIYEEFSKIDETKVKKIYPTAEFISEGEPTEILTIKK